MKIMTPRPSGDARVRSVAIVTFVTASLAATVIAACGGGGGSAASVPPPPPTATPSATPSTSPSPSPSPTPSPVQCLAIRGHASAPQVQRPLAIAALPARIGPGPASRVCSDAGPGKAHCLAWIRNDIARSQQAGPAGYGPANLQSAYGLTAISATNGGTQIVAIVDAYDDTKAESDLAVYRSTFGLPPCTTANGCFMKVNQSGFTSPLPGTDATGGWEGEESLDVDMVSAVCPLCHILLIETNNNNFNNLYAAEDVAAGLCASTVISDSWSGGEYSSETADETHFNHPGVMIMVASGDHGYNDPNSGFPGSSRYVTAVGGTHLTQSGSTWTETVWTGSGSYCSVYVPQPAWQTALGSSYTSLCGNRIDNDVAAVADPNTGVAVYDTFGGSGGCPVGFPWCVFGGTSASAPIIGAVYALAGNGASLTYGSYPYTHTASLTDITTGTNGTCGGTYLCKAKAGFDAPTGNGSPLGIGAF